MKVCHLTSVHKWNDTRILLKECTSLSNAGFDVTLVVPEEKKIKSFENIKVISVPPSFSRFIRATQTAFRVFKKAIKTNANIFHFHDPELIWVGILLKILGKKVIFDIHENIREQIKIKEWLPFRNLISRSYFMIDWLSARFFYLVLAERSYEKIYFPLKAKYCTVLNMPDINYFNEHNSSIRKEKNGILYIGNISINRCIPEIIEALSVVDKGGIDFTFHCVGELDEEVRKKVERLDSYKRIIGKVRFYGHLPLYDAYKIADQCKAGISILKPIGNYFNSYSTKIFEYMAISMPVITSNFPIYKEVIEKHKCGICINPLDPDAIAGAINYLFEHDEEASQMGINGRKAVETEYNWSIEEKKLVAFYKKILDE